MYIWVMASLLLVASSSIFGVENKYCFKCHSLENLSYNDVAKNTIHSFAVNPDKFQNSIHSKINCIDCHEDTTEYPHPQDRKKVGCNSDCHSKDEKGQVYNHEKPYKDFAMSVHSKEKSESSLDSPDCVNCHGQGNPHYIEKAKDKIPSYQKITQCIVCHDNKEMMKRNKVDPDSVESYKMSYHYKAVKFGGSNSATCQDCHTPHKILSKEDPKSTIHKDNLKETCGQSNCHKGVDLNFAMSGANHLKWVIDKEPILYFEQTFFYTLTGGTMVMLAIGIVLDIQKKFGWSSVLNKLLHILIGFFLLVLRAIISLLKFLKKILWDL